jgi:hypothetical protein
MLIWCKEKTLAMRSDKRSYVYKGHTPLNVVILDKQPPSTSSKSYAFQVALIECDRRKSSIARKLGRQNGRTSRRHSAQS